MSKVALSNHAQRSWWQELLLVDFRHAFWPWVAFIVACVLAGKSANIGEGFRLSWIGNAITFLSVPAIVCQVFAADYKNATMQSFLTFPKSRSEIWLLRVSLIILMILGPVAISLWFRFRYTGLQMASTHLHVAVYLNILFQAIYCFITYGILLAVLIRKPLVSWTAIVISPLLVVTMALIVQWMFAPEYEPHRTPDFPYVFHFYFYFAMVGGMLAIILAYRQWLRLEVRS